MNKKLRIALPCSSFLPAIGGAEVGLHNICLQLLNKGHQPFVITNFSHARKIRKISNLPYMVISLPPKISSIFEINQNIGSKVFESFFAYLQKKFYFDFWHATFGYPLGIVVIEFCKKKKIPHLLRCVGQDIQIDKKIPYGYRLDEKVNSLVKKYYPLSDCMVAVTKSIKDEYLKIGVAREKIEVIPNGVDTKRIIKFGCNKTKKFSKERVTKFLALGRYHKKKNFEILIPVFRKLQSEGIKFRLVIAGTNMNLINKMIKESNLEKNVEVLEMDKRILNFNEIPDNKVFELYKSSDCFIMTSKIESFGIVTVEAMSFGLPVIAANSAGNRDILENGNFGIIYNGSEKDLFSKIKKVIKNNNILVEFSKKSIKRSRIFDWSIIVDKYISLYYSFIKSR